MRVNLADYTGAAASASAGAGRPQLDPREIQRLDRQDRLFTTRHDESEAEGYAPPTRSAGSFSQAGAGSAAAAPLNPATAAKAAAAMFGMSPALGRRASMVKTSESMQPVGNAAQLVAKQRRSSVSVPDSVTQGDIMSR